MVIGRGKLGSSRLHVPAPSRQPTELFGQGQPLLQQLLLGDVLDDSGRPAQLSRFVRNRSAGYAAPDDDAVLANITFVDAIVTRRGICHAAVDPEISLAIFRMSKIEECHAGSEL